MVLTINWPEWLWTGPAVDPISDRVDFAGFETGVRATRVAAQGHATTEATNRPLRAVNLAPEITVKVIVWFDALQAGHLGGVYIDDVAVGTSGRQHQSGRRAYG